MRSADTNAPAPAPASITNLKCGKMAVSRFFCHVCLKDYHFASRFERHVHSASHQRMEEMIANQSEDSGPNVNQQPFSVDMAELSEEAVVGNTPNSSDSEPGSNASSFY